MAAAFNEMVSSKHGAVDSQLTEATLPSAPDGEDEVQPGQASPSEAVTPHGKPGSPAAKAKAEPAKSDSPEVAGKLKPAADLQDVKQEPKTHAECLKCGLEKAISDMIKKNKKFICKPCNCAASMLSKAIEGGFDGKTFLNLPPEDQQEFWRNAAGASKRDLVAQYDSQLRAIKTQTRSEAEVGDFLPLSVWESRGFDVERIKQLTPKEDRKDHPILGETFRVNLSTSSQIKTQTWKRRKEHRPPQSMAPVENQLKPLLRLCPRHELRPLPSKPNWKPKSRKAMTRFGRKLPRLSQPWLLRWRNIALP